MVVSRYKASGGRVGVLIGSVAHNAGEGAATERGEENSTRTGHGVG